MEILIFYINACALVCVGLFGILTEKNMVKILLALNIVETGINLFLVAIGYTKDGIAPIITGTQMSGFVDPLPQALVLTSIVIGLGTTALALGLIMKHVKNTGSLSLESVQKILSDKADSL
ncbi:MAG: cation:proton antiporter subunit C [Spirochaetales bacterium]|nr:cation:proton antiporter subunit C [Spirochaetales bacterium]